MRKTRKITGMALFLAGLILILSGAGLFGGPLEIDINATDIQTGLPIDGTVKILNCSNQSQVLEQAQIVNGIASITWNSTWSSGYMVLIEDGQDYTPMLLDNNTYCYHDLQDFRVELYPAETNSITVTVKDWYSKKPIQGAKVWVKRTNINTTIDQTTNYLCQEEYCTTNESGMTRLIVPNPGTYQIIVEHLEYENATVTTPKFGSDGIPAGEDLGIEIQTNATTIVAGTLRDKWNNKPIENAKITLVEHYKGLPIGEDPYHYNTTTDENGYWEIHAPASMLQDSYDIKIEHPEYGTFYDYNGVSGVEGGYKGGNTDIQTEIEGPISISIVLADCYSTSTPISDAEVTLSSLVLPGWDYTITTNATGGAIVRVRNTSSGYSGYTLSAYRVGYDTYYDAPLSTATLYACMNGNATIEGVVVDDQNKSIPIGGASVTIESGGVTYETTTGPDGTFSIRANSDTTDQSISVDKNGYDTSYVSRSVPTYGGDPSWNIQINLSGSNHISGYVVDKERDKRTGTYKIKGATIRVYNTTTGEQYYETTTDANGLYTISVPSTGTYLFEYSKVLYNKTSMTLGPGEKPPVEVELAGATRITIDVSDEISQKPIVPDSMAITDSDGNGYFFAPNDSRITIDAAVSTPYNITLAKTGYETREIVAYGSYTDNVTMTGAGLLKGLVTDKFSGKNLSGAYVVLLDNNTGEKEYETVTAFGYYSIRVDSSKEYEIAVFKKGYKPIGPQYLGTIDDNTTRNYQLEAGIDVRVHDWQNKQPVPNATVYVYHYYNTTINELELQPTIVNISVECRDKYEDYYASGDGLPVVRENITVTINHTTRDAEYTGNTSDTGIVEFWRVPTGIYNMTINATQKGCVLVDTPWLIEWNETNKTSALYVGEPQINVSEGGVIYNYSYSVPAILLNVYPVRYNGHEYENITTQMNVSYEPSPGTWTLITLHDIPELGYRAQFVAPGVYNVTANSTKYYHNQTNCTVSPVEPINPCNVLVHGKPGTLEIRVKDSGGSYLSGIPVNLTNGTHQYSQVTDADGWANFTLAEWWNVTINGTSQGYKAVEMPFYYIEPLETTIEEIVIDATTVTVTVTDDNGPVEGANVSLINLTSGGIAVNAEGVKLTALTDTNGQAVFTKVIPGDYNVTAWETSHGSNTKTVTVESNKDTQVDIGLGRTRILVTVQDTNGNALANIPVTIQQGSTVYKNNTDSNGVVLFEETPLPSGAWNITVNGTSQGYNITTLTNYNIEGGITNQIYVTLSRLMLALTVLSEYDDRPCTGVRVEVNTTPVTVYNTDAEGKVNISPGMPGVYNVTVNPDRELGYNSTWFVIDLQKEEYRTVRLKENIVKTTVLDEYGDTVLDGVRVCVADSTSGGVIYTATGVEACNRTTSGIAIIRQLPQYADGPYNITVEGGPFGYGDNSTQFTLTNGVDEYSMIVNVTMINTTVTSGSTPVQGATVVVFNATSGVVLKNATGDDAICETNAEGWCVIRNIGMTTDSIDINVTVNKDADLYYENYTVTSLKRGEHKQVHLDPPQSILAGNTYYEGFVGEDKVTAFFNLTDKYTGNPIPGAEIRFYAPADGYANLLLSAKTNTNGIASVNLTPGVYDIIIDGSEGGYGLVYIPEYKIGRLVFNHGNTDGSGFISLLVDGQNITDGAIGGGYYVRIESPGYEMWDSFDMGWKPLHGTYYDHTSYDPTIFHGFSNNQSLRIEINGSTIIRGRVSDKYASPAQPDKKYLAGARVTLYTLSGTPRYTTTTDENGNYSMRISVYQKGAPEEIIDNQEEYKLTVEKEGYKTYSKQYSQGEYTPVTVHDPKLEGNTTESGWVLTYDNVGVGNVTVILRDSLGNELYRTYTDATGRFEIPVNPLYLDNYTIRIVDEQENIIEYESGYRVGPTQDEKYYVLESGQALYTIQLLDEEDTPVSGARVNITKANNPAMTLNGTTEDGIVKFLLDGVNLAPGTYNVTIDALYEGYQVYEYQVYIPQGYTDESRHINSTRLNLTIISDEGGAINDTIMLIYNENATFVLDGVNLSGHVVKPIPPGTYNLTFLDRAYYFGTENTTQIAIPPSAGGTIIDLVLTTNETVLGVTTLNETLGGINTTVRVWDNETTPTLIIHKGEEKEFLDWYNNVHTIKLLGVIDEDAAMIELDNETEIVEEGDVLAQGERNMTIESVIQTKEFNMDGLIVVTLEAHPVFSFVTENMIYYYSPEAYNKTVTSTGEHRFTRARGNTTQIVVIDDNQLWSRGYLPVEPIVVTPIAGMDDKTGNNISVVIRARKLNITLTGDNETPEANITVLEGNTTAANGLGNNLTGETTNGTILFYNVLSGLYNLTIDGNHTGYGVTSMLFYVDPDTENNTVTQHLSKLSISYTLIGYNGTPIDPSNTNVSLYYTTSDVIATNTTGSVMLHSGTDSGEFEGLYQLENGNYTVRVSSLDYFDNATIVESPSPENPMVQTEITLTRRNATIAGVDFATQARIEGEALTITLTNTSTRQETTNLLGEPNTVTTTNGTARFEHLENATYYVNVSSTTHYYPNDTLVTPITDRSPVIVVLKKKNHSYVNVTTTPGALVELVHNDTGIVIDSITAGSKGIAIVSANLTEHSGVFYVRASKTGYATRESGYLYLSKEGEVKTVDLVLPVTSESGGGYDSGGGASGGGGGGGSYVPPPTRGVVTVTPPQEEPATESYAYTGLRATDVYGFLQADWFVRGIESVTGESFATPAKRYELAKQTAKLAECVTIEKKSTGDNTILERVTYSCSEEAIVIVGERVPYTLSARPEAPGVTVYTPDEYTYIAMARLTGIDALGVIVTTSGKPEDLIERRPFMVVYNPIEMSEWQPPSQPPAIPPERQEKERVSWTMIIAGVIVLIAIIGIVIYYNKKREPPTYYTGTGLPPGPSGPEESTGGTDRETPPKSQPEPLTPPPEIKEMEKPLVPSRVPTMETIKKEVEKNIETSREKIREDAREAVRDLSEAERITKEKAEKLARERGFITRKVDEDKYIVE